MKEEENQHTSPTVANNNEYGNKVKNNLLNMLKRKEEEQQEEEREREKRKLQLKPPKIKL